VNFLFSIIFFISLNSWGAELQLPSLKSSVMDLADLLNENQRQDLSQLAYEIYTHNGPQITILTVPDLQGYDIADYSIRVAEKWQLGTKEKDNGLLVVISKAERMVRIEVGNGIEGEITDYDTSKYTRDIFPQYFRQGQFYEALRLFMEETAVKFNIKLAQGRQQLVRRAQAPVNKKLGEIVIIAIFVILVLGSIFFKGRPVGRGLFTGLGFSAVSFFLGVPIFLMLALFLFGLVLGVVGIGNFLAAAASGHGGRYGGGGGGGGGGGWSGGGGGFSGGGSSGRW
jgi:uncharacterized protein